MSTPHGLLLKKLFLSEGHDPKSILALFEPLEPYFKRIETKHYPLYSEKEIGLQAASALIACATQRPVKKIIPIAVLDLSHGNDGVKNCTTQEMLVHFFNNVTPTLSESLRDTHWKTLESILAPEQIIQLRNAFWRNLGDELSGCLSKDFGNKLTTSLWSSLFYYLGFALAKHQQGVDQILPLIHLLLSTIPLGESKNEPGTWYTIVASATNSSQIRADGSFLILVSKNTKW